MVYKKILLIDDNEDNRILIQIALKLTTNWELIAASNGMEGIAKAQSEIPNLILLDVVMPDIDGFNVYQILKRNLSTRTIPVIFITALVNSKILSQLKATGAIGIIIKPLNTITLACDIARMCGWDVFSDSGESLW